MLAGLSAIGAAQYSPIAGLIALLAGSAVAFGGPALYSWRISSRRPTISVDNDE